MSTSDAFPDVTPLHEDAARWLARLSRGLEPEEGLALREWLKAPAHREAMLGMAPPWQRPDIGAMLAELFPSAAQPPARRGVGFLVQSLTAAAAFGIVAFAALALSGGLEPGSFLNGGRAPAPGVVSETYATAIGNTREVTLADKSVVTLNTGTRMTVLYSPRAREVTLTHGEASFVVKPEADRPFHVYAGRREFQAVGTRFNVRVLSPEDVELIVTEGNVKVLYAPPRWPETPAKRRENLTFGEVTLNPLETALVQPGYQSVRPLVAAEMQARLAWQRGMMIFDSALLEDALAEVDRYTTTKFVLADAKLRAIRIGGNFRTGDVDGLLRALREDFRIDSRRDTQGRIVLTALRNP